MVVRVRVRVLVRVRVKVRVRVRVRVWVNYLTEHVSRIRISMLSHAQCYLCIHVILV